MSGPSCPRTPSRGRGSDAARCCWARPGRASACSTSAAAPGASSPRCATRGPTPSASGGGGGGPAGGGAGPAAGGGGRPRRNVPGADFRAMTDAIPLEDASVDLVWCSEVLEHVPDTAGLLSEVRRVLTTGGRVLATTPAPRRLLAVVRWEQHFDPLGQHVRFYSRRSLTRTLETFAFEAVEVRSQRGMLVARARKARLF